MMPDTRVPVFSGGVVFALVCTVAVHVLMGIGMMIADAAVKIPVNLSPAEKKPRGRFGEVAYERRHLELDCTSIPECEPQMDAVVIELKVAKLGMAEPDPHKLPELQTYEQPEKVELGVNVDKKATQVKPLPYKEFLRKKSQLDRRKRRKKRDPFKSIDVFDDDPRKRPTAFEKITGRLDGNPYGRGVDQQKFDHYFGRVAMEFHKRFSVPTSLSKRVIQKQRVSVHITEMGADGSLIKYKIRRKARKSNFTMAAIATLRAFMPAEGGQHRLPPPDDDILRFVNTKGIVVDLDGRLFQ
ncbi:MAG TPA: hypothetical protein EYN06_04955 [Myxococcales bacterium]|nr:hypothetical protein [Myxococcales bacterium]HIN85811.1 hypothetical protein [Myxococcales bacterium]